MQNPCTKLKVNKPCYWLAGFVYILLTNRRVCLTFVNQQQGLFTSSLLQGFYMSKGLIDETNTLVITFSVRSLGHYVASRRNNTRFRCHGNRPIHLCQLSYIAWSRLKGTVTVRKLKKPDLLNHYDSILTNHLKIKIIEKVHPNV